MNPIRTRLNPLRFGARLIGVAALGLFSLAQPQAAMAQSDQAGEVEITEKARAHFRAGVNLLQDPDGAQYDEAYQQFQAAYAESPSWKVLGNIGLSAMKLERYGEAIEALSKYLEQGGDQIEKGEREQYQRDVETLSASVVTLTLKAAPRTKITDVRSTNSGRDVRNFYVIPESGVLELGIRPGQHSFTADPPSGESQTWDVLAKGSSTHEHAFGAADDAVAQAGEGSGPIGESATPEDSGGGGDYRIPAYVALGVGAVGVGLGTVFLIQRMGKVKDGDDIFSACESSQACGETEFTEIEDADKAAASKGTISLISYGVGAVGIGTGVALLLMSGGDSPVEAKVGNVRFRPYASFDQLGLFGNF